MTDQVHNSQFTIHNSQLKNPNLRLTMIFVQALARAGVRHVIISPGSRSTPLTLAFAAQAGITVHRQLDERSAGFFGLGLALATDAPVALVCTSGTAVANYLPAVVEANMSQIPLLILTGDRPPELRHSGANQTIDQVKIFGEQVLWSVDMPLPEADPPDVALRNVAATAVRATATANGIVKGPVHVNFPFRKPLEPGIGDRGSGIGDQFTIHNSQFTIHNFERGNVMPTEGQLDTLTAVLTAHPRGVIVCGPRCPDGDFPVVVAALARQLGWPIFADPLSGVRFGPWVAETAVLSGYETYLQRDLGWEAPQVVLRFGAVPTSKWLNAYLDRIHPAHHIHVRAGGVWADDGHRTTHFLQANETAVCRALIKRVPARAASPWLAQVEATEDKSWRRIGAAFADDNFDGAYVADLLDRLPADANLFVGNSLPVRHLDQYGRSRAKRIHVYGNRGASGIDGNIATGLGIAAATNRPTFIVVGDVTALHDLNSLQVASGGLRVTKESEPATRHLPPATIIILNNDGGSIFRRLPIAQHDPPFTDLFLTPHGLHFAHAAAMFGLAYQRVESREEFAAALATAVAQLRLIEVVTDGAQDDAIRRKINQIVNGEL